MGIEITRWKSISPYGHTLLTEIATDGGISEEAAYKCRQGTLGSLFYRGLVRVTNDPKRKFVITEEGSAYLVAYVSSNVARISTVAGWSARLPEGKRERAASPRRKRKRAA